jgi:hypothetical protein
MPSVRIAQRGDHTQTGAPTHAVDNIRLCTGVQQDAAALCTVVCATEGRVVQRRALDLHGKPRVPVCAVQRSGTAHGS